MDAVVASRARETLSLIHFLRFEGQPQTDWLNILSADESLSEPVRDRAMKLACDWKK